MFDDFSLQRGNSILYFSVVKANRKIEKFLNALKVLKTISNWVLYSPINNQTKLDYHFFCILPGRMHSSLYMTGKILLKNKAYF